MIAPEWQSVRRLLAVRLDNLGDVILTTPAIHALAEALPRTEITLLAGTIGAPVGYLNPDLHDVIVYQAPWVDPWQRIPHDAAREQRMIAQLRDRSFDAAVIFTSFRQSSLPAAYLSYLAGIPLRLGASIDGSGSLLTTRHRHPERLMHEVERGLDLVAAVGIPPACPDLVLAVPDGARAAAASRLESLTDWNPRGPVIVVHPGCSMPARTYPWQQYAAVIAGLVDELDATVIMTGLEEERPLVDRIYDHLPLHARCSVHGRVGDTPLAALAALIEQADLVITNNTGPMHVAAAVKTPVVALFALTNPPEQWGPWRVPHRLLYQDVPCRICYSRACPRDHACLLGVTPEMVVAAAGELLNETVPDLSAAGVAS